MLVNKWICCQNPPRFFSGSLVARNYLTSLEEQVQRPAPKSGWAKRFLSYLKENNETNLAICCCNPMCYIIHKLV